MSYKRTRPSTVQLTSLLDLLFVMIFVSLIQQKQVPEIANIKKVTQKKAIAPGKIVYLKKKKKVNPPPVAPKRYSVQATFNFYPSASTPNIPKGSFLMQGRYDSKDNKLRLGGVSWIQRPRNYDMVPLSGTINPKLGIFRGRIEFQGCREFTLKRINRISGSPIAGIWKGSYACSQGETGLTLKIE